MSDLVIALDDSAATLALAGGKGASLSRLLRAGFAGAVPPGFVVTTRAYQAFVAANGLAERIAALATATTPDDPDSFERASQAIRAEFARGAIPDEIAAAIRAAYAAAPLAGGPVAVRSSATAEDLPEASFAGQQETLLNVRGEASLLGAVQRCWSSLWTGRALAYRARQGIAPEQVSLAVVVQALVPAEAAGILFTINPVTGAADEIVVNAAWGLGEAVVGGQVNPDNLVLDKASGAIKSLALGDKAVMTALAGDGTAEAPVAPERRAQPVLGAAEAAELARLARAIEAACGGPQDIEWALAGGRVAILQARPVTALPAAPAAAAAPEGVPEAVPGDDEWPPLAGEPQPFDVWTQADVGERWPEPVTPLSWSSTPFVVDANMRFSVREANPPYLEAIRWSRRAYGRVYFNEGALGIIMEREYGMSGRAVSAALGGQQAGGEGDGGEGDGGEGDGGEGGGGEGGGDASAAPASASPSARMMLRRLPLFGRMLFNRLRSERTLARRFPQIEAWVAEFTARDLEALDDRALWQELEGVWLARAVDAINLYADLTATAMLALPQLADFLGGSGQPRERAAELVQALSGVRTAEMVPALWQMARTLERLGLAAVVLERPPAAALAELRARPEAGPFRAQLEAFLRDHGHRCASELEFRYPRWAEAPEQVLESIAGYLRAGPQADPAEAQARRRRVREAAEAETAARLNPLARLWFRGLLRRTQHVVRLRDNGQHFVAKLTLPLRRLYAVFGERWAARGWLAEPDDVFFLVHPEIGAIAAAGSPDAAGLDLGALVAARRQAYAYWLGRPAPEVLGPDGRPLAAADAAAEAPAGAPAGAEVLSGFAGSSGRARGVARLIAHPREAARLQPGDILVTRSTDPGWTPVFPLVSGLVLEVGGQLSHGAIVAREYGIPAVLNVAGATRRIRDGQTITVDGTIGRVYLE